MLQPHSSESPSIRIARPSDAETVAHIQTLSWQLAYKDIFPEWFFREFVQRLPNRIQWWQRTIESDSVEVWLLRPSSFSEAVGFIGIDGSTPHFNDLRMLYLLPEHVGKGHGKELLNFARGISQKPLMVWCLEENQRALQFYKRMGAEEFASRDKEFGKVTATEIGLRWEQ